ncbi:MAG: hypothetical protein ACJAUG_000017 [Halioglobus sp.]|jgi:hypothetical protein
MGIYVGCACKNIEIDWQLTDRSLIPRSCQCSYCVSKGAAYISKSGTKFSVTVHNKKRHRKVQHGSNNAIFHECGHCDTLVFVTVELESDLYGVINSKCVRNDLEFSAPIKINFEDQSLETKKLRWRQNWCCPVLISVSD